MSLPDRSVPPVPEQLRALVDDAATFPPVAADLATAVAGHREHLRSDYAGLVGTFVVTDVRLPDLTRLLEDAPGAQPPLRVGLVVTGGAGALDPAVRWASRASGLELVAVEFALRDEDDLAHNARRVLAAADSIADELAGVALYVEMPRLRGGPTAGWLTALDELAAREVRLRFRTGGADPDDFATPEELAAGIAAGLDRELPFKCTGGLRHAVRRTDPLPDGRPVHRHGFLNILRATRAELDGDDTAAVLAETDAAALLAGVDPGALARARAWFTSFSCSDLLEVHEDLVELGLVAHG